MSVTTSVPVDHRRDEPPEHLTRADRVGLLRHMLLMRAVEERAMTLYRQGKVPGSFYDGHGQEAVSVGPAWAMAAADRLCVLHRDLGAHLVRGVQPATGAGETVAVGMPLARIEAGDALTDDGVPAEGQPPASGGDDAGAEATGNGAGRRLSPVVQRIAADHAIDLSEVEGTGRDGRIRKQDVLAHVETAQAPLHTESPFRPESVPKPESAPGGGTLSRMRRTIGEHMKRSLETAATCTTWIEVDMSRVERERAALGLTALPLVARATIDALREHPHSTPGSRTSATPSTTTCIWVSPSASTRTA